MSGDGFHVSVEELRSHSESVDGVAEAVDEAAQAAATERAGGLVYGVLFDALALPPLNWWADRLHGLIAQDARLGHSIAEGIASNADTYDGIEQENTKQVTRSGEKGE